jgi:integration host factor subunit beta
MKLIVAPVVRFRWNIHIVKGSRNDRAVSGGNPMNKSELVEALATRNGLTYKKSEEIVNIVFDSMAAALTAGDRIEIRGFGSFVVKDYQAYMGRNPKTGEVIKVKPKKLPFFKVGKELRDKVNSGD